MTDASKKLLEAVESRLSMWAVPWWDGPEWVEEMRVHAGEVVAPALEAFRLEGGKA